MKNMIGKMLVACVVCLLSVMAAGPSFASSDSDSTKKTAVNICQEECLMVKEDCVTTCDDDGECKKQCIVDLEGCTEACEKVK